MRREITYVLNGRDGAVRRALTHRCKNIVNVHRAGTQPDVFLFSTPRSGSTWVTELLMTQPGFTVCDEPFNLRDRRRRRMLGVNGWEELYARGAEERIAVYMTRIAQGRVYLGPWRYVNPFSKAQRGISRRVVVKIIHAGEDRIEWFKNNFQGKIIYLVRHPLAVSFSRTQLPRVRVFLSSEYRRHFTRAQIEYAQSLLRQGEHLEHAVLSWCLQNMVPLHTVQPDWSVVSYEQLVLDPEPVIARLIRELELKEPEKLRQRLKVPSSTVNLSDQDTREKLACAGDHAQFLVQKWRKKISPERENKLMDILKVFDIDLYRAGDFLPSKNIWIR
ncbi:MAG: hypothetical protein GF333_04285 [Candidatus Omnitrophica bacterium]|nr:hypothetical protein [Candidatus Omnitrophota bacterium]